jgi:hypothetical protein
LRPQYWKKGKKGRKERREGGREGGRRKKESNYQPRLLYPAKLSFRIKGEVKTFHTKHKLREFMTTRPALQKMLKGILYPEEEEILTQS